MAGRVVWHLIDWFMASVCLIHWDTRPTPYVRTAEDVRLGILRRGPGPNGWIEFEPYTGPVPEAPRVSYNEPSERFSWRNR